MQLLIPILSLGAIFIGAFVVGMGTGDTSGYQGKRAKLGRVMNQWILGRRFPQPMYQLTTVAGRKMTRVDRGGTLGAVTSGERSTIHYSWTVEQRATEAGGRVVVALGIIGLLIELPLSPTLALLGAVAVFCFHFVYYPLRKEGTPLRPIAHAPLAPPPNSALPVVPALPTIPPTVAIPQAGRGRDRYDE